jgi:hypothetical protein
MEALKLKLTFAKECAQTRRKNEEEVKRTAGKIKRNERYLRKKETASGQGETVGEQPITITTTTVVELQLNSEVSTENTPHPDNKDKHEAEVGRSAVAPQTCKQKRSTKGKQKKAKAKKKAVGDVVATCHCQPKTTSRKGQWKEYSQKYRDKLKSDPLSSVKQKEKEHERYLRRKESKKIKLISDMTEREKRKTRRRWRVNTASARTRRDNMNVEMSLELETSVTTTHSENIVSIAEHSNSGRSNSSKHSSGRKRVRRDRTLAYVQLSKAKLELKEAQRRANKYKKRFQRIRGKINTLSPSPASKVRQILSGRVVPLDIRKRLVYGECVDKQLKHNSKEARTVVQRQQFVKSVSGGIMKKYKMLASAKVKHNISWWLSKHATMAKRIRHSRRSAVNAEQAKQVASFLVDDTNSRMCAGKKECITWHGEKQQKRFLNNSLLSLHQKYLAQFNVKMSYATFCRLRPFWVVEPQVKDRETCLCVKHENTAFLVSKLNALGVIEHNTPQELCKALVCSLTCRACMHGECDSCKSNIIPCVVLDGENKSFYYQWKTASEKRNRAKDGAPIVVKITSKQKVEATYNEMMESLKRELPNYKEHQYRVNHQQTAMSKMKESLRSSEVLMLIDFSENYMCKYGSETQSVHFGASRKQITLHTGVFYYRLARCEGFDAENIACKSFCTLSESMRHDPSAIWAHLKPVLSLIQVTCPNVDTLHIWSDGPTTQYRNRRNFGIFSQLHTFGNFKSGTWNFSESGHGKGAADGIGGSLKRRADKLVAHGEDITNAELLLSALQSADSATQLYMVQEDDIKTIDQQYDTSAVKTIKGTMLLHQVTWTKDKSEFLSLRSVSCLTCPLNSVCSHYNAGGIISLIVKFQTATEALSADSLLNTTNPKSTTHAVISSGQRASCQTTAETMAAGSFTPTTKQTSTSQVIEDFVGTEPISATSTIHTLAEAVSADSFLPMTSILFKTALYRLFLKNYLLFYKIYCSFCSCIRL